MEPPARLIALSHADGWLRQRRWPATAWKLLDMRAKKEPPRIDTESNRGGQGIMDEPYHE